MKCSNIQTGGSERERQNAQVLAPGDRYTEVEGGYFRGDLQISGLNN